MKNLFIFLFILIKNKHFKTLNKYEAPTPRFHNAFNYFKASFKQVIRSIIHCKLLFLYKKNISHLTALQPRYKFFLNAYPHNHEIEQIRSYQAYFFMPFNNTT